MSQPLTDKQEQFARAVASGKGMAEAYRSVYNATNMAAQTVSCRASDLMRNGKVADRVKELRAPAVAAVALTAEAHMAELERLKEIALGMRKVDVAVRAEELRGKVSGLYVTKIESGAPGEFQKMAAENKARAIDAIQAELTRRALLDNSVTDVEPKE